MLCEFWNNIDKYVLFSNICLETYLSIAYKYKRDCIIEVKHVITLYSAAVQLLDIFSQNFLNEK